VQDQWAGEALLGPDGTSQHLRGEVRGLALMDLPADDLPAEDVDDEIEVEEAAEDRAGQPVFVP